MFLGSLGKIELFFYVWDYVCVYYFVLLIDWFYKIIKFFWRLFFCFIVWYYIKLNIINLLYLYKIVLSFVFS